MTTIQGLSGFSQVQFGRRKPQGPVTVDTALNQRAYTALKQSGQTVVTLDNGAATKEFYGNFNGIYVLTIYNKSLKQNFAFHVSDKGEIQLSVGSHQNGKAVPLTREMSRNMVEGSLYELLKHLGQ